MKILIYGAGVIGSVYAAGLKAHGHDITVLDGPERAGIIREHGLLLEDVTSQTRTHERVRVIESLDPSEFYDWVIIPVRREQVASVVDGLSISRSTPNLLFFGNNIHGVQALTPTLGRDRILFGFPGVGGKIDGKVVRYMKIPEQKTTIGELDGQKSDRLLRLARSFEDSVFPIKISKNIDHWLKTHALFVTTIAAAIYQANGSVKKLATNHQLLKSMVQTTDKGFKALASSGIKEKPFNLWLLYEVMPTAFAINYWKKSFNTKMGEFSFEAHANIAKDEIKMLAGDLRVLLKSCPLQDPTLDLFFRNAGL